MKSGDRACVWVVAIIVGCCTADDIGDSAAFAACVQHYTPMECREEIKEM